MLLTISREISTGKRDIEDTVNFIDDFKVRIGSLSFAEIFSLGSELIFCFDDWGRRSDGFGMCKMRKATH